MILTCGEALVDMVPAQTTDGKDAFLPVTGGASLNSAIALARLGASAGMVSGVSTDLFGEMLVDGLAEAGVATDYLMRSDRPTTLAFVRLKNGNASYTFYDVESAGRMVTPDALPELPASVSALMFGGISLIAEPGADTYRALAERHAKERVIYLDPNIRANFVTNEAAYRNRLKAMVACADIIKVSDDDLEWLGGTAEEWLAGGCSVVIITRGSDGATIYTKQGEISAAPEPAKVADTIGAGDTFNAGFLCGLLESGLLDKAALASAEAEAFRPAMNLGNAAAAITVSRVGANPPFRSELSL